MRGKADEVVRVLSMLVRPRLVVSMGGAREFTDRAFRKVPGIEKFDSGVLYTAEARQKRRWFSLTGT
ncbi:MAG: hypothetical protein F4Z35_04365 [Dehalococcoidia bacterium]|nr:hypothetical protein [Dehalococcoidia bacterium]